MDKKAKLHWPTTCNFVKNLHTLTKTSEYLNKEIVFGNFVCVQHLNLYLFLSISAAICLFCSDSLKIDDDIVYYRIKKRSCSSFLSFVNFADITHD